MPEVRLTHFRVMMPEILTPCIYRVDVISPCRGENRPRPGCTQQRMYVVIIGRGRLPLTESCHYGAAEIVLKQTLRITAQSQHCKVPCAYSLQVVFKITLRVVALKRLPNFFVRAW